MTQEKKTVRRLSFIGIFGNIILSAFKLIAGLTGHSPAMVSDAVHSLSDVFATFIAFLGVKLSCKDDDAEHPYGHDRFECVAAIFLGLILAVTGAVIGWKGIRRIVAGSYTALVIPGRLPLFAAVVSIIVKEGMFRYTLRCAKQLGSAAFEADAWHHRSDALSSVGSLAGIAAARLGFPVMEPVAGLIICLFILKTAYDILADAFRRMMDTSCGVDYEKRLRAFIGTQPGVEHVDLLHTRLFGNKIYVDVEIAADGDLSLAQAHEIAEQVHDSVEANFPNVKHVMVHMNPCFINK